MKDEAVANIDENMVSFLSGSDYDQFWKEIAQYTIIELDSKYKVFNKINKMIGQSSEYIIIQFVYCEKN